MRVVVIGGGVIGLMCAHHLVRRGALVTLLERAEVGAACSAGNAGWITPSISHPLPEPGLGLKSLRWLLRSNSPLYIKPTAIPRLAPFLWRFWRHCNRDDFERGAAALAALNRETMELYDQLKHEGLEFEQHTDGLLMVFGSAREMADELALLHAHDYGPLTVLGSDELHDREPALTDNLVGGILVESERTVRPEAVSEAVATDLRAKGQEVIEHRAVTGLRRDGRRALAALSVQGEIEADAFLVATGAEAAVLSRHCASPLPLQAGKGYSVTLTDPGVEVRHPLYLSSGKIGVTPFGGALRIAGTMELSGINLQMDSRRVAAIERSAELNVPGILAGGSREQWVGMRPLTPDGLPVLGRLPTMDNVYVATGHQMLGVTLAPATGKAMAELIVDGAATTDLSPFSVERFGA